MTDDVTFVIIQPIIDLPVPDMVISIVKTDYDLAFESMHTVLMMLLIS